MVLKKTYSCPNEQLDNNRLYIVDIKRSRFPVSWNRLLMLYSMCIVYLPGGGPIGPRPPPCGGPIGPRRPPKSVFILGLFFWLPNVVNL